MAMLFDERTDTQKVADAWVDVKDKVDATTAALVIQSDVLKGLRLPYSGNGNPWVNVTGRAGGGNVRAGTPYIVGEKSPELFVPDSNGRILPNAGGTTIQSLVIQFNGVNAPRTPAEASRSGNLFKEALRANGVAL
jgi:hypothetical protein